MKIFKSRPYLLLSVFFICYGASAQVTEDWYEMSLEELMNVEIYSASKKAESSFEAPLSSTVVTREEIIASGATTIEEVFRLVPGMIVREESNGNFDIHIRGNSNVPPGNFTIFTENTMTLVMIDGRKVYNTMNGGTFWETIPVSVNDIERVEVIRGPSTSMYGPNAVSGVINITTKKSKDGKAFGVDGGLQIGSQNTLIGDLGFHGSVISNKLKYRASINMDQRDRFMSDYYGFANGEYVNANQVIDYQAHRVSTPDEMGKFSDMAKEKTGVNASLSYLPTEKTTLDLSFGHQESKAQTVFMETTATPLSLRSSNSSYLAFNGKISSFDLHYAATSGEQDIYINGGAESTIKFISHELVGEYAFEWDKLNIRPGLSYQLDTYDDTPFKEDPNSQKGYLNGRRSLSSYAGYIRGDYKPLESLRLIASLRYDKYDKSDEGYFTYQLVGSYKLNSSNIVRIVASKANRGPFMVDTYANYYEVPAPGVSLSYQGGEDLKLPTMNMYEFGYRSQIAEKFFIDLEIFHTITKDWTSFVPTINFNPDMSMDIIYKYRDTDLVTKQTGSTLTMGYTPSNKLQIKGFITYQQTNLEDFDKVTKPLDMIPLQMGMPPTPAEYERVNMEDTQSPSVYGGIIINYLPIEKLSIYTNLYATGSQKYTHDYSSYQDYYPENYTMYIGGKGEADVKSRARLDLKVAYKVYKNSSVFLNGRNVLGSKASEFGFADEIGGLYLAGIRIDL